MRLLIIFITLTFLIVSCSRKEENNSDHAGGEKVNKPNAPLQKTQEITLFKFNKSDVPPDIKFEGNIVDGAKWTDVNGDNILFITETKTRQINNDEREEYIYAYTYSIKDTAFDKLWSITDHVRSYCDVGADYIPGSIEVLDVDKDGIAETAFFYKLEGRCDVSPLDIKLMMHTGDKKLVIRGTTIVDPGDGKKYGGDKNFDTAFGSSPEILKDFASQKWDKFIKSYEGP